MGLLFIFLTGRIVITEVMANARGPESTCGDRNEYIELYNDDSLSVNLAGFYLSDFDCPADSICPWLNDTILVKYPAVRIRTTILYPRSYALILDREYLKPDTIFSQPYRLPDSTLILTTDDTSLGDGLANNDPLIIFQPGQACTTSFGTPEVNDNFPADAGDGIAWERIIIDASDEISNWHPSLDTSGGTPGKPNRVSEAYDLSFNPASVQFNPSSVQAGEDAGVKIVVKNNGLRIAGDYNLIICEDKNRNQLLEPTERLATIGGVSISPGDSAVFSWLYRQPSTGTHAMGFWIDYEPDINQADNQIFKDFKVLESVGLLALSPPVFSPNADNIDDILQIDYRLPAANGRLSISIFDTRGTLIRNLCRDFMVTVKRGTMFWNGQAENGKTTTGRYIVLLEYRYAQRSVRDKKTAVLVR